MDERETHIERLKAAEQQFRLACTVNLAVTNEVQTLDVPVEWTFGRHRVRYEDFGLRPDQATGAAMHLEKTATFVMAAVIRDALWALFPKVENHSDPNVASAFQIARLIRNAFAHNMLYPTWSIDAHTRDRAYEIADVIALDTTGLNGVYLDWRHYGGPLAIYNLGRFARVSLLNHPIDPNRVKPAPPKLECYQQGRLIARRLSGVPANDWNADEGER